jgi:streptogramin lyase
MGNIETIAGTGQEGYGGDGGDGGGAIQAHLNQPFHHDLDREGNLYIAEAKNHCIRKLSLQTGIIATVAGGGQMGFSGDGGPANHATMNEPYALQVDINGDIYIVDRLNAVVRKVDARTGTITTVAGNGTKGYSGDGGLATGAQMREPNDCFLDGKGGLLIADVQDHRVRRLDLRTGIITTFAGTGEKQHGGDGGPATQASINGCRAICVGRQGNTYVCEREGNGVRKVDAKGIITTIAGTGERGYAGDGGPASRATFDGPKAIRCDKQDNLYVVDTENHAIRRIDENGDVSTVAGGRKGGEGDGGHATKAGLDRPHGCVIDDQGNIYIADSNNNRVRLVKG